VLVFACDLVARYLPRVQYKDKVVLVRKELRTTSQMRMGEWMYRVTLSWPRHYMEVCGKLHAPTALRPGAHRIEGWVGRRAGLNEVYSKFEPTVVQPVASRFTDCALLWLLHLYNIEYTNVGRTVKIRSASQIMQTVEVNDVPISDGYLSQTFHDTKKHSSCPVIRH
jgi:hypothetical protein